VPKLVDHQQRRAEIIEAVWTLVARDGFGALTMRDIASELHLANGALTRYFPSKSAILRAALERANAVTNERAAESIGSRTGLDAFRRLCLEIMPLDEVRLAEARVVIGFWAYAASDSSLVAVFDQAMEQWRSRMVKYLVEAAETGEFAGGVSIITLVDTVMATLMGLQVNAIFSPQHNIPARQVAILDALIADN
jgi:AcrR family transcriptional regulator